MRRGGHAEQKAYQGESEKRTKMPIEVFPSFGNRGREMERVRGMREVLNRG